MVVVQQINQMIAEVDKDGSGTIDFDEFVHMMTDKMGERDARDELYKAFRIIDKDGNVRRLELLLKISVFILCKKQNVSKQEKPMVMRRLLLPQGKISDIDIQRLAIETGEHFTLDEVREMIEAADENGEMGPATANACLGLVSDELIDIHVCSMSAGDGEIDLEEFMKMMRRTNLGSGF